MNSAKKLILISAACTAFISCPPPSSEELKAEYRLKPSAEYNNDNTKELNTPPKTVTIGSTEYKAVYKFDFTDAEAQKFYADFERPNQMRRSSYWIDDMVYVQDDVLNVTTQAKTGTQIKELIKGTDLPAPDDGKRSGDAQKIEDGDYWGVTGAALKKEGDLYGLYVARIAMDRKAAGHWMAYWFYGQDASTEGRKIGRDYEFDMLEYHQINTSSKKVAATTHWPIELPGKSSRVSATKDIELSYSAAEYHTYALLWTPDEVVYYIDWEPVSFFFADETYYDTALSAAKIDSLKKTHKMICDVPLQIHFSNEVGGTGWMVGWAGALDVDQLKSRKDNMKVDWYVHYTTDELKAAASAGGVKYGDYLK